MNILEKSNYCWINQNFLIPGSNYLNRIFHSHSVELASALIGSIAKTIISDPSYVQIANSVVAGSIIALGVNLIIDSYKFFKSKKTLNQPHVDHKKEATLSLVESTNEKMPLDNQLTITDTEKKLITDNGASSKIETREFNVTKDELLENLKKEVPELKLENFKENELVTLAICLYSMPKKIGDPVYFGEKLHGIANASSVWPYGNIDDPSGYILSLSDAIKKSKIIIEVSADEIIENFNNYGIIKLRPLQEKQKDSTLVFGCGQGVFCANDNGHFHKNVDTVDMNIKNNPSIVAVWGRNGLRNYFMKNNIKYQNIVDEGPIAIFLHWQGLDDDYFECCFNAINDDGNLYLPDHVILHPDIRVKSRWYPHEVKIPKEFTLKESSIKFTETNFTFARFQKAKT